MHPPFCSRLLLDCLDTSKCIFVTFESLQSNKNMLLHAWLGGYWEWLIVFCDSTVRQSDIADICLEISEIIKTDHSTKHVIILTSNSVQEIRDFFRIEHEFKFEQLSKESQEIVLDKAIDFQGCEVTMRSVLQRHGNVQHVLGPELVTDLITEGTAVNIGGRLQLNEGYYAPRELKRYIWLHTNVLQNTNDVFAVSGETIVHLRKILPSGKTVERFWAEDIKSRDFTEDMSNRMFFLSDKDAKNSFLAIGEKIQRKTLHWVELRNGDLLWKMSIGGIETLLDYIDAVKTRADKRIITEWMKSGRCEVNEEAFWDLGERTVLVVAEPGMGKSSTTTQVAQNTKLADPTSWVVHIKWNDHTTKLQDIKTATFNFDSLVEFLCSAAFPKSKYTDINRILLKQALQNSGNVTVLMDGFDEISPTHADKSAVILSELMKTKVGRVWVTSRPVEKERLEKELSVSSLGIKRLSQASQIQMLCNLCKYKADEKEELHNFLRRVNFLVRDENFTSSPLYIMMIATVYEMLMKANLKSENWQWTKIDLVTMYEVFVERKLHIFLTEKQKADKTNSSVLDNFEDTKKTLFNKFEKCALVAILPATVLESLHVKKIKKIIKSFLAKVQAGKDKTGIVMNVVDGKPQFVHRTFAEFFTARWFSRNFKFNRNVLKRILFDRTYRVMMDMFDRMLARGFPLHCAVFEKDETILWAEGLDLNAGDKGGRTIMHLIARSNFSVYAMCWDAIKSNSNYEASLHKRDSVLQWTPLQFAVNMENWFIVGELLESNVDRSGLDTIKQRAQNPDYTNPDYTNRIIAQAARNGHLSLLEFLRRIGVNIHQESSTDFPSTLHIAIREHQLEVVKWLIQHGADCNTPYSDGQIPLFHAVTEGLFDVVRALVDEGRASVDVRGDEDRTVIDWAKKYEELEGYTGDPRERAKIVQYLEERLCQNNEGTSEK